jgi:hypothetical protein
VPICGAQDDSLKLGGAWQLDHSIDDGDAQG